MIVVSGRSGIIGYAKRRKDQSYENDYNKGSPGSACKIIINLLDVENF